MASSRGPGSWDASPRLCRGVIKALGVRDARAAGEFFGCPKQDGTSTAVCFPSLRTAPEEFDPGDHLKHLVRGGSGECTEQPPANPNPG